MKATAELPPGVASLFGVAARRRRRLEERLVSRLEGAGFEEVILPVVDYLEPYEPLLTPEGRAELYRFTGRDGELLALRADFTPMLARLLAPRLDALDLPLALYYRGDVVRCRAAGVGRPQEVYQLGAELLGVPGEAGERRMLLELVELLGFAASRCRLVLGFAGALDEVLALADDPAALVASISRREREAARRWGSALLEVVTDGLPVDPEALGPKAAAGIAELEQLRGELAEAAPGLQTSIDLAEFATAVRSPELVADGVAGSYYDGVIFRCYAGGRPEPVASGGRYDTLFASLAAAVPAVGFTLSVDRLVELVDDDGGEGAR